MSVSNLVDWLGLSNTSPQVKPTTLPISYFRFPPSPAPLTVPPPPAAYHAPTLARPFTIPTSIYNDLLKPQVPITIALVYISLVSVFNQVNANRNHKPWAISRTRFFKLLVILHNIFLAVYSAWTCVGMINALTQSLPAWNEDGKVSKTVDALCKMHGPRLAGNAATYNATTSAWTMTNRLLHIGADGLGPETSDVGRIWNEGLAFYGWLFYLSKFYEIVDTLIILAKGRRSSLLQTYHHAGAMLSMWAGIRYMSPPIWMFVMVNSGVHAIMYTFYLLSTVGIKAPKWFKQTLTTLQISQFVVGTIYAFLHLFIAYQIPVRVPYLYHLGGVASSAVADGPTEVVSSVATAISTAADYLPWAKKLLLRGAGYEGLAENVLNEQGKPFGIDAAHIAKDTVRREETRYRDEMQWVQCLDTSGQVFAILLNCMYLLPLTWLFFQFFITSYLKQVERRRSRSASDTVLAAQKSFFDASKGVSRHLNEAVQEMHNISEDIGDDTVFVDGEEIKREMKEAAEQAVNALKQGGDKVKQSVKDSGVSPEAVKQEFQRDMDAARKTLQETADKVKNAAVKAGDPETREKVTAKAQSLKDSAAEAVEKAMDNLKSLAGSAKEQVDPALEYASEKAGELKDQAGPTVNAAAEKAADLKDRAVETVQSAAGQAKEEAPKVAEQAKDNAKKAGSAAKDTAQKNASQVKESAPKSAEQAKEAAKKGSSEAKDTVQKTATQAKESAPKAAEQAKDSANKADKAAKDTVQKTLDQADEQAPESAEEAKDTAKNAGKAAKDVTQKSSNQAKESASKAADKSEDKAQKASDSAKAEAEKAGDSAKDSAQKAEDTSEATAEDAQSKAEDLSKKIDDTLDKGASEGGEKESEVEKFTSKSQSDSQSKSSSPKKKSPNGNGTGAEGASGSSPSKKKQNKQKAVKTEESEETKVEKKEEDQIIDESQVVRDEDVDTEEPKQGDADGDDKEEEGWGV